MKMIFVKTIILATSILFTACQTSKNSSTNTTDTRIPETEAANYVIKINVSNQQFSYIYPWLKRSPYKSYGRGVFIGPNMILAPSRILQYAKYIELEDYKSEKKFEARIKYIDYSANLAILEAVDSSNVSAYQSIKLADKLALKESVNIYQFEANGDALITEGKMQKATLGYYPDNRLLVYLINVTLPGRSRLYGTPVLNEKNQLSGLASSYNSDTEILTLVPSPVIQHFLNDCDDATYDGFPKIGFGYSRVDSQLRDYLSLPESEDGLYLSFIRKRSPADNAGLKVGDVILKIDDYNIDKKFDYIDPDYGKLEIGHLISTRSKKGDKRLLEIWRNKKKITVTVVMDVIKKSDFSIIPNEYEKSPQYINTGGLVFLELSRPFLQSWKNWRTRAPQRLVNLERNQWELFDKSQKIIILGSMVDNKSLVGYRSFRYNWLRKLNNKEINSLQDIELALKKPVDGKFHVYEFEYTPKKLVLDKESLKQANEAMLLKYRLPALKNLN
ncbi:MAG: PDZ domain-containing protein [Lentisphaeria bacterium]|nr:PDZ domain-containing protein [Lentisphaeria bacterium]NQZ69409.1 PDZ domain-containing protein [Lentisphaeria bacterium]